MSYTGSIDIEAQEPKDTPEPSKVARRHLDNRELEQIDEVALRYWLNSSQSKSQSTYEQRLYTIFQYVDWFYEDDNRIVDANPFAIENYIEHLEENGYAENSKSNKYYTIKSFYNYLRDRLEYREGSPFAKLKSSDLIELRPDSKKINEMRKEGDVHYLEPEQISQLVDNVPKPKKRNRLLVRLAFQTGLRAQEVADIRLRDVDTSERSIKVYSEKTDESRTVWYQQSLEPLMNEWIRSNRPAYIPSEDSDYLFASHVANKLAPSRVNKVVKQAADRAGIQNVIYVDTHSPEQSGVPLDVDTEFKRYEITAHTLRHSYAVQALKNGINIKTLAKLMGHEDVSTTEIYLETLEDEKQRNQMKYGPNLGYNP